MPENKLKKLKYKLRILKTNRNKVDVEDLIKVLEEQIKSLLPVKERIKLKKERPPFKSSVYPDTIEEIKEMLLNGKEEICKRGYNFITYKNYKAYKYRLVMLSKGYKLNKKLQVHHIDCNKLNDSIDNLVILPFYTHFRLHRLLSEKNFNKANEIITYYKSISEIN